MNFPSQTPKTQPTQSSQVNFETVQFETSTKPQPYAKLFVFSENEGLFEPNQAKIINLFAEKVFKCGRGHHCDLRLQGKRISALHFSICQEKDSQGLSSVILYDLSTNGTWVNLYRVGKHKKIILKTGDEILVGLGVIEDEIQFIVQIGNKPDYIPESKRDKSLCDKYDEKCIIGQGAFAVVKMAFERRSGKKVAIKTMDKNRIVINTGPSKENRGIIMFQREVEILKSIDHPNIVKYFEMFDMPNSLSVVMEYVPGGDLMDFLINNGPLKQDVARRITKQIIDVLAYLHPKGIVHRDLKPENILMESTDSIKITDFGLAKIASSDGKSCYQAQTFLRTFCGTLQYLAPEVIQLHEKQKEPDYNQDDHYDSSVDLWSLGCIVFTMLVGETPFYADTFQEISEKILRADYPQHKIHRAIESSVNGDGYIVDSKIVASFVDGLIRANIQSRMTLNQVIEHPWVKI